MARQIPWTKSLSAKLGAVTLLLLAASLTLILFDAVLLGGMHGDATKQKLFGKGATYAYQIQAYCWRLLSDTPEKRATTVADLRAVLEENSRRYQVLLDGDPAQGIPPVADLSVRAGVVERANAWRTQLRPAVERVINATTPEEVREAITATEALLARYAEATSAAAEDEQRVLTGKVERTQYMQYLFAISVCAIIGLVLWIARGISRRARLLATAADRIAAGELNLTVEVLGADELTMLGEAFNSMTATLRKMIDAEKAGRHRLEAMLGTISETASNLASSTAEILAGTSQQSAGAQEQAVAVTQTVTTVDEVMRTAEQAAQRAKAVADAAQRSLEVSKTGTRAVDDSSLSMATVKEQTEAVAESIVALAERAQAIAEIIAAVNDIAEQTNLLALNAGIEASRAGEHGRGFSVVANEVKALADQSKKATAQVRQILGEIQRATNSAVMSAEEASKSVNGTMRVVQQAGETIRALGETINEAAQVAAQIAASAGQQSTGMSQIHQAMRNINQATTQNLASTKQTERAARDLNSLGVKLKELVTA